MNPDDDDDDVVVAARAEIQVFVNEGGGVSVQSDDNSPGGITTIGIPLEGARKVAERILELAISQGG